MLNEPDLRRARDCEERFAAAFLSAGTRAQFLPIAFDSEVAWGAGRRSPKAVKRWSKYRSMLVNLEHSLIAENQTAHPFTARPGAELLEALKERGAPADCYRMSTKQGTDGRFVQLADAVEGLTIGDNETTLLICCPESHACSWHGEIVDASALFIRRSTRQE